ncbi:MAG: hypothetical protein QF561_05015 [Phycisphaerales bacterium]|nr:hypothetical protein [Phycisphaerales bacterium]
MTITNFRAAVRADTATGSIKIRAQDGPVTAESATGSIVVDLADQSTGPVACLTSTGSISLSVGPAFHGVIAAHANNGSITASGSTDRITGRDIQNHGGTITIGSGGAASTLKTSTGSVKVNVR